MPIAFNCSCGKMLRVPDTSAGKRAKCPACNAVVEVPAPDPVFEIVEEEPPKPQVGAARHGLSPAPKPVEDDDSDDGGTYKLEDGTGGGRSRKADDDDSDGGSSAAEQPKKNKLPNFRKGRDRHK